MAQNNFKRNLTECKYDVKADLTNGSANKLDVFASSVDKINN